MERMRQSQKYKEDNQKNVSNPTNKYQLQEETLMRMTQIKCLDNQRMRQFYQGRQSLPNFGTGMRTYQPQKPQQPLVLMQGFQERRMIQNQQNNPHQISYQRLQDEIQIVRRQSNLKLFEMIQIQAGIFNQQPINECNKCGFFRLGLDFHNYFHIYHPCQDSKQCFSIKNFGQIPFYLGLYSDKQMQQQQQNDLNFWGQQQNIEMIVTQIINKLQKRQMDTKISEKKIKSLIDSNQMCLDCSFCKCQGQAQLLCPQGHILNYMSFYDEMIKNIQCHVCYLQATYMRVGTYRCNGCDFNICMNCSAKQRK